MTNTINPTTGYYPTPPLPTISVGGVINNTSRGNQIDKAKKTTRIILSLLILVIVVGGSIAGYFLTQQLQDIRQSAAPISCSGLKNATTCAASTEPKCEWRNGVCYEKADQNSRPEPPRVLCDELRSESSCKASTDPRCAWMGNDGCVLASSVSPTPTPAPAAPVCSVTFSVPAPGCNQPCTAATQCQATAGMVWVCISDTTVGTAKYCRNEKNPSDKVNCALAPTPTPTPTLIPTGTPKPTNTPTPTPTRTSVPTATPKPQIGCNTSCVSAGDCKDSRHICYANSSTTSVCRLESNPGDINCQPVASQPSLPETLPATGPEDWINWLKAGLAVVGIGAALLLML